MIFLTEVATKLNNILNGTDTETSSIIKPNEFQFLVQTHGVMLDTIADFRTGKNIIPVFISQNSGNFNPVADLGQMNITVSVSIYFPAVFKDSFYDMAEYFSDLFVGKILNYGTKTGNALSNISPINFEDIQELDLKQFYKWVEENYKIEIEGMMSWISMSFSLFLSTAKNLNQENGFLYGNDVKITLTYGEYSDEPVFVSNSLTTNGEPSVEQILGEKSTKGVLNVLAYATGFEVYVKINDFYRNIISSIINGDAIDIQITFTMEIQSLGLAYERLCYIPTTSLNASKGSLMTLSMSFAERKEGV